MSKLLKEELMVVRGETEVVLAHLPKEQYQTGRPVSVETHLEGDFTCLSYYGWRDRWMDGHFVHAYVLCLECGL